MDKKITQLVRQEQARQAETITLIPSENYTSKAVRKLVGSVLMNKYSEGYAQKRYYQGNTYIDSIEELAISQARKLFGVPHANVQPYSGSPANNAVFMALLSTPRLAEDGKSRRDDRVLGLNLSSGGHLTHGHPDITFSGKYFKAVQFGIEERYNKLQIDAVDLNSFDPLRDSLIDYDAVAKLAEKTKPKVIIIGSTAYPLIFDWQKFSAVADRVNAYLVADISHVAGLIVGGDYPSPAKWAHIITTTTHKTLRGPRGAIIMATKKGLKKDPELAKKIDRAVFPGLQGGPHDNTTAAIAQCLHEADTDAYRQYCKQVVANAKRLALSLSKGGLRLVGNGTATHLILVDLRPQNLSGNILAEALEASNIVVNRNSIPGDKSPFYPSGIRLGTPAVTTRGMGAPEMKKIADWILKVVDHVKDRRLPEDPKAKAHFIKEYKNTAAGDKTLLDLAVEVKKLCRRFPLP